MGNNGLQEKIKKFKRLIAVILCVIMATGTGVSSLAELGPLTIWIPVASDSNASAVGADEEEIEGSRVVIASWSDATLSDATASNAVNWQVQLQARIDALPGIQEIQEDETKELLVDTYWEVLDIMEVIEDETGIALYDFVMDADDGSIEGADELDVSRLYEIADYVMAAYTSLEASEQMGDLTFVTDAITVEPYIYENLDQIVLTLEVAGDNITIVSADDKENSDGYHENDYYSYYTGETLTLDYTIYGGIPGAYDYRIYFKPDDPAGLYDTLSETYPDYQGIESQISFYLNSDGEVTLGDYSSQMYWDKDEEAWYVEFTGIDQQDTVGGTLQITYPSPTTPGGDLLIYGVIYDADTGDIVSRNTEAFDANWKTEPETFEVAIALDETQEAAGLILQTDSKNSNIHVAVKDNPDQDIIYTISMKNTTEDSVTDEGIGEDLIRYIDVTETIILPAGIRLNADVFPEPTVTETDGYQTIEFTSGDVIVTLLNRSENDSGNYSWGYNAKTNTLTITWRIENSTTDTSTGFASSQIEDGIWEVRLNGDYLVLDDEDAFNAQETHEINNTVQYTYVYTWSEDQENEAPIDIGIANPSSNVVLTKTADRSDTVIMGEDAYYTISLYNQGVNKTTNLTTLTDSKLDVTQYITTENIWKMFFGDTEEEENDGYLAKDSGDYLTLVITDAWLYYSTPQDLQTLKDAMVNDMEGETTVYKTGANYDIDKDPAYTAATITIKKAGDKTISVAFAYGGKEIYSETVSSGDALEELFLRMGYVVTASARYSLTWDLSGHQMEGGETRHYKVYSSIKNTFQYWENLYLNYAEGINTADNTVYLHYDNTGLETTDDEYQETDEATAEYTSIPYDFMVQKTVNQIDGDTTADTDVFYRGSVVTYQLLVQHNGTSTVEDLPLVDEVTGTQFLLIPANDKNYASLTAQGVSATGLERNSVTCNGKTYYSLNNYFDTAGGTGGTTYKNIWLDDDHCAATIVVKRRSYTANAGYSMAYTITWNYDTIQGTMIDTLTYNMLIGDTTTVTDAENTVYLNGRYNENNKYNFRVSALYDEIDATPIKSGSLEKKILTSDPEQILTIDPRVAEEEETYSYSSVLDIEENQTTVYYKLQLETKSGNSALVLKEVKDILPYTYGKFDWSAGDEGNVKVLRSVYANPDAAEEGPGLENADSYRIYYSDADGTEVDYDEYMDTYKQAPYQTLAWEEKEGIVLPANAEAIWIYVQLDFPSDSQLWQTYADAVSGNLKNTFSAVIGSNTTSDTATVIHSIKKDAKAYLQKGVYWINTLQTSTDAGTSDSREIYFNATSDGQGGTQDGSLVAYYIQLYNASSSYLYLEEIQDQVPDGFELVGIYGGTYDYQQGNRILLNDSCTTDISSPASDLEGADIDGVTDAPAWVEAGVKAETDDDGIVRFTITLDNAHYEEETGYYYLAQGEAVSFIAEFEVGDESETERYATNKIAMPYVNLSGGDISVANVDGTAREAFSNTGAEQNVGGCRILSETDEREEEGFQAVTPKAGEITEWLSSEVTVRNGEIIPGINKSLDESESSSGGIYGNETVNWIIEVSNDGTIPMMNYTITDNIDSPFLINGKAYYRIYGSDDEDIPMIAVIDPSDGKECPLFEIERYPDGSDQYKITWYKYDFGGLAQNWIDNASLGTLVTIDPYFSVYDTNGKGYEPISSLDVDVTIEKDPDSGNDIVSIDFAGSDLQIGAGNKSELTIQTKTLDGVTASRGTYYNLAAIIPAQSYDDEAVTIGEAVPATDTDKAYVKSSDQVHVSNGYSTSAQKWIQSMDDPDKIARSEVTNVNGVHYINLTDTDESFTYTLEVTNSLNYPMTNLVIVDALPQSGDSAPFAVVNDKTLRESEFQVDLLAGNLGWSVIKGKKKTETADELADSDSSDKDLSALDTMADYTEITDAPSDPDKDEYYTVHYSTTQDFGLGMTSGSKWNEEDGIWTDNVEGARSVRIEIHNADIQPGDAVQVSFNAIISSESEDTAVPGEIGWNSFAYKYTTSKDDSVIAYGDDDEETGTAGDGTNDVTLWAAPRKVGVKIPGVPRLTKALTGVDAETAAEMADQTFRFLVHEGEQLKDFDYSDNSDGKLEERLTTALTEAQLNYFIKELTVDVSEGISETILLEDKKSSLVYTNDAKYTVVELPNGSSEAGNGQFVASHMDVGDQTVNGNVITFTYSDATVVTVYAGNQIIKWSLKILKQDEDTKEPLQGVVFGLYSRTNPHDDLDDKYGDLLTTPSDAGKITVSGDSEGETETWYLIDAQTTDEDGAVKWSNLTEDVYYLKELKVPDGYYLPATPIRVDYWDPADGEYYTQSGSSSNKIVTVTVDNKIGYRLPKTGGRGTLWIQLLGLLLMCMGVSLTYITKRKITSSRRTK